jgi:hypothetical protein
MKKICYYNETEPSNEIEVIKNTKGGVTIKISNESESSIELDYEDVMNFAQEIIYLINK